MASSSLPKKNEKVEKFLVEYANLVDKYNLIFVGGEIWDVPYLLDQSNGWNDRSNYRGFVYPETKDDLLKEILLDTEVRSGSR